MQRALRHRGPDDQGLFIDQEGVVALAHTRLSIQDLSSAGHQPMTTPDGRYTIVFNGEIYNFRELRKELQASGIGFASGTDTEVILHLFAREGARCVARLRGMYAFAVWDALDRSLLLARDPFGIKPLYFLESGRGFYFASEVRALLAGVPRKPGLDPAGLARFLESGSVAEDAPLLAGVRMLPPGHAMHLRQGRTKTSEIWAPNFPAPDILDHIEAVASVREALAASVQAHLVSDVPVGVFLSGGLDSTALVALARVIGGTDSLATYSISVDDPAVDEGGVASQVARHFQTRHRSLRMTSADATRLLPDFLAAIDMPSVDGFNTWLVASLARESGTKTTLSGLGGDELFGGYPSFTRVPAMVRAANAVRWARPLVSAGGSVMARFGTTTRMRRLGEFLEGVPTSANAYRTYRGIFSRRDSWRLAAYLTGTEEAALRTDFGRVDDPGPQDPRDAVSRLEFTIYLRNQLLRDSDVMSMAHGLELRVPFVDAQLFDALVRIAPGLRYASGKRLLVDAVPEIPEFVRDHPKRGFTLPYEKWLREALGERIGPIAGLPVATGEWYQRWSLFVLGEWRERVLGEASS